MSSVSVIIPTYNRRYCLARALDSVLAQTKPADEIIVVDDGSSDGTAEFIADKYPQVHLIIQENAGVSSARNAGILAAKSDWIAFLDSDDAWDKNKLIYQFAQLFSHPEYRVCHSDEVWYRDGKRVNPMLKHAKKGGRIFQHCLPLCAISPSAVVIHRSVFDDIGLFDASLPACEDYDLWLRITAKMPVLFVNDLLTIKYGGHEDQLSKKYWGMDRFRIQSLKKILDTCELSADDASAAREMMQKKIEIYVAGAKKRGKFDEAAVYEGYL